MEYPMPTHQLHFILFLQNQSQTHKCHVPWHLTETGETIPNLPNNRFPDFRLCAPVSFICGYFLGEYPFG